MKRDINLKRGATSLPRRLGRPLLAAVLALMIPVLMAGIYHGLSLYRADLAKRVAAAVVQNEKLLSEAEPLSMMEKEIERIEAEMARIEALSKEEVNWSGYFEGIYAAAAGVAEINLLHAANGERIIIEGRAPSMEALAGLITSLKERPYLEDVRLENAKYRVGEDRDRSGSLYPDEQALYDFRLSCRPGKEGSNID